MSIDSTKASLKQAQDAYARQQQLWKGGLTTKEPLDNAENQLQDARSPSSAPPSGRSRRSGCG